MVTKSLEHTFSQFGELLQKRFTKDIHTTEDSVRYTFFYCLTQYYQIDPSDIVLEKPHNSLKGCFVDTYIKPSKERPSIVFEFKYDREIPSERNSPRTQKAGKVFADLFRLALFETEQKINRYFVYVTDNEMIGYFNNRRNNLYNFFNLPIKNQIRIDENYIKRHAKTFVKSAGKNIASVDVICCLKVDEDNYSIRIYEIKPTKTL